MSTDAQVSRRRFMANATITIGGLVGLSLAIPIAGALVPDAQKGAEKWTPLDRTGWRDLQTSTDVPVKIAILGLTFKDAYIAERPDEYVWGIKVRDISKFRSERPDLFAHAKARVSYAVGTIGFAVFSPICPHLGCNYQWNAQVHRFLCPCHGSEFDRRGAHVGGPAARGLDPLPLRERAGEASIEWIRYASTTPDRIVVSYLS